MRWTTNLTDVLRPITTPPLLFAAAPIIAVVLVLVNMGLGVSALGAVLLVLVAALHRTPLVLFAIYVVLLLFQNLFIAVFHSLVASRHELIIAQGTQFLALAAFSLPAVYAMLRRPPSDVLLHRVALALLACTVLTGVYFLDGVRASGFQASAIYLRSLTVVPLSIVFGLYVGASTPPREWQHVIIGGLSLSLLFGLVELVFPTAVYNAIDAATYFSLKKGDINRFTDAAAIVRQAIRPAFNLHSLGGIGFSTFRVSGPNLHSISYAYAMAAAAMLFAAQRAYWRAGAAALLLLAIQAKGPLIMLGFAAMFAWLDFHAAARMRIAVISLVLTAYAALAVSYGMHVGDYHVLGLIGGAKGFVGNVWGHGLGTGGNLVATHLDWEEVQAAGATTVGTESMIGVMLYQVGLLTLPIILAYLVFFRVALKHFRAAQRGLLVLPYAYLVTCVSGLFQEEAYGPFALGLLGMLLALHLGWEYRAVGADVPESAELSPST